MRHIVPGFAAGNITKVTTVTQESIPFIHGYGLTCATMTDAERDERTGDQWICSTISYLNFNAGTSWRKIHRAGERFNETRWYFLAAANLLNQLKNAPVPPCACSQYCRVQVRKQMGRVQTYQVKAAKA